MDNRKECLELLKDPEGTNLFREFLHTTYASEVLNMWIDIEIFKQLDDTQKMQEKGQYIFDKYCRHGEKAEVNIDENLKTDIKDKLDRNEVGPGMFDGVQGFVFDLLCTDCFMGFRHANSYVTFKATRAAADKKSGFAEYLKKLNIMGNRKSLTDSEQNLRTYFEQMKRARAGTE